VVIHHHARSGQYGWQPLYRIAVKVWCFRIFAWVSAAWAIPSLALGFLGVDRVSGSFLFLNERRVVVAEA